MLSCQCSYINKELNNERGYLFQLWDSTVFYPGYCRLLAFLLWADSLLIDWKWSPECQRECVRACSSLSYTDKLIIIFTLNRDLSVFSHLYYHLIVGDTTSAHLGENKTHNHGNSHSPRQPMEHSNWLGLSDWWTIRNTNVRTIMLHERPNVLHCSSHHWPAKKVGSL